MSRPDRRQFITGAAALAAYGTLARGVGGFSGRLFNIGRMGGWRNPYVTDGLIAMWDGEWNAGGGVHDSQIRCVDLSGNGHTLDFVGDVSFGDNYFDIRAYTLSSNVYGICDPGWTFGNAHTQEFVFVARRVSLSRLIAENRGLEVRNNLRGYYGFGNDRGFGDTILTGVKYSWTLAVDPLGISFYENSSMLDRLNSRISPSVISTPITIGNRESGERGGDFRFFSVRLYGRTLSDDEIAANYAIDKERFGL